MQVIADGTDANSTNVALSYAGRVRSPSPAAGHFAEHVEEQNQLVADALVNAVSDSPK